MPLNNKCGYVHLLESSGDYETSLPAANYK
jgi:hypothetical protein